MFGNEPTLRGKYAVLRRCLSFACAFALTANRLLAAPVRAPEFGARVIIFSPTEPAPDIQKQIDRVYSIQQHSEFGHARYALFFLPGTYHVNVPVGYYTQVLGLGASPEDVRIFGNVYSDASLPHDNATTTFWRSAEGLTVIPDSGTMRWAVSQAAPLRRMHIRGNLVLNQHHGWASGGWMSDAAVDGTVDSGTQQQWISRNCSWGRWIGSNWNMVFVGDENPPDGRWPSPSYTEVAKTPIVREPPFLEVDHSGRYFVNVPSLRTDTAGISWNGGLTPGRPILLSRFYIAHASFDTAATLNAQLARGRNLLFTPGIYELHEPVRVLRPNTVILGLGFATLRPMNGTAAMTTADANGIIISGLLFDAGPVESPVLLQVGPRESKGRHLGDPITLSDVFFRVGGDGPGRTHMNLEINSSDTIIDHTWIWRADHGADTGWTKNISDNGLVVNGVHVTAYGLFVEHHQQYQVLWNGDWGSTYFYQSEIPYDPPDQDSYRSRPGVDGWASYKVNADVRHHEAWGLGIYSVFLHPNVILTRAIEVPRKPDVRFHDMITVALGNLGSIEHVVDDTGRATSIHPRVAPRVTNFP